MELYDQLQWINLMGAHDPDKHQVYLENYTALKSSWLRDLRQGCLNKSLGDKLRIYSHLRALSNRKLSRPFTREEPASKVNAGPPGDAHGQFQNSGVCLDPESVDPVPASRPSGSPVILEDLSKPPDLSKEIPPESFTINEFFNYLWSDDWDEDTCLRVVGGELLDLLLMSLYELEKNQQLNSHVVYANLNNRQKTDAKNVGEDTDPRKAGLATLSTKHELPRKKSTNKETVNTGFSEKAPPVSTAGIRSLKSLKSYTSGTGSDSQSNLTHSTSASFDQLQEWNYENMVVQLVFYERADPSNVIYEIQDTSSELSNQRQPVLQPRNVILPALSQQKHKMNYLRLPVGEDARVEQQVLKMKSELQTQNEKNEISRKSSSEKSVGSPHQKNGKSSTQTLPKSLDGSKTTSRASSKTLVETNKAKSVEWVTYENVSGNIDNVHSENSKTRSAASTAQLPTATFSENEKNATSRKSSSEKSVGSIYQKNGKSSTQTLATSLDVSKTTSRASSKTLVETNKDKSVEWITYDANFVSENVDNVHSENSKTRSAASTAQLPVPTLSEKTSSSSGDFQSIGNISDILEKPIYEKLNLSRKELYVTGLYLPRDENRMSTAEKLSRIISAPSKTKDGKDPTLDGAVEVTRSMCAKIQPKRAAGEIRRNIPHKAHNSEEGHSDVGTAARWSRYIKEQEEMEMKAAVNNSLRAYQHIKLPGINGASNEGQDASKSAPVAVIDKHKAIAKRKTKTKARNKTTLPKSTDQKKKSALLNIITNSGSQMPEQEDKEDKDSEKNFNDNAFTLPHRRRQVSETYLYNRDFQEDTSSKSRSPNDYEIRGSFLIAQQTPYLVDEQLDESTFKRYLNKFNSGSSRSTRSVARSLQTKETQFLNENFFREVSDGTSKELRPHEIAANSFSCTCVECTSKRESLAALRPDVSALPQDYPLILGRLRRDFSFLAKKETGPLPRVMPRQVISYFSKMDIPQISEQLMKMVDNIILRKEILTSSLGHTYITVTFTKSES